MDMAWYSWESDQINKYMSDECMQQTIHLVKHLTALSDQFQHCLISQFIMYLTTSDWLISQFIKYLTALSDQFWHCLISQFIKYLTTFSDQFWHCLIFQFFLELAVLLGYTAKSDQKTHPSLQSLQDSGTMEG